MRRPLTSTEQAAPRTPRTVISRPTSLGVDPVAAEAAREAFLSNETDTDGQPYCTCRGGDGFTFDPQIGIYVHAGCWKPSKAYHLAATAAGIINTKEKPQ